MELNVPADKTPQQDFRLQKIVSRHQKPSRLRSSWQLINSIGPYLGLVVLMYYSLEMSYWVTLGLAVLAAGFLIRTFIIFHDCGHGSFFKSKKAMNFWGAITGVITFTPYYSWNMRHAIHHATSGDLDQRGVGDVWTMTVKEYLEAAPMDRFKYRFYRHPLGMFILGPLQVLLIKNRRVPKDATPQERSSILWTNAALAVIVAVAALTIGIKAYLLIQVPIILIGLSLGIWLFYVQHQFEGVYWERSENWDYVTASLEGSSYYKLPRVFQWFTGNIGFHHIHHLNERIPNYNLPRCHAAIEELKPIPTITFFKSLKAMRYRLWDEENRQLVGFGHLRNLETAKS
ncbi:MAG: fatty acid desaturase [bacterium]|nr:fatty acid desaturase [bacterium]